VELHHGRGRDELVHRSLKEFRSEAFPFKRFAYNAAYYYTMLVAMSLFESFKEDVCAESRGVPPGGPLSESHFCFYKRN
jgi:hypothetical protein